MRNTRLVVAVATVAVVAVAALFALTAGDDGGDTPASGGAGTAGVVGEALDPDRQAPAAPVDGAVDGGTVTVLFDLQFYPLLDPSVVYYPAPSSVLSGLVTRSLTQYVYDSVSGTMVLVPDIATDLGTPNADFTEWTYTIRPGVRFEDGSTVTAQDVAFGIERSFDRVAFEGGPKYSNDYFLDGHTYKGPYRSGTSYDGIVVDGDTLTLKMARPFPDMPYWAAFPAMGPIPETGSNPAAYGKHPMATGPYKFDDHKPGKLLTLVKNEQWDADTDPGRHQYPDRYVFKFYVPAEQIFTTILGDSDRAQTMMSLTSVSASDYPKAKRLDRVSVGSRACTYMWFPDNKEFTDIRVREAIGYAYPYREIARAYQDILGFTFLPGASTLPPDFPGRQDYDVLGTEPWSTDPEKAQALLKEAGYASGEVVLKWPYNTSDPASVAEMDAIVKALEAVGFEVKPVPTASGEAFNAIQYDQRAPINIRGNGWCYDWPSGNEWFPTLFDSEGFANFANFDEPAVEAEIERISQLPLDERPAEWGVLDQTIMTDYYPAIITGYERVGMLYGSKIGGINSDGAAGGMPTWKDIYVVQ